MDLSGSKSGSEGDYLRQIIDRQLADLHTGIPAIVESFDPATQMIECIPVIRVRKKNIAGEEYTEDRPKLVKIPLLTPYVRVLGFSMTMPIVKGDVVAITFAERGLDYWQETGEISDPPEDHGARMHDLTDGIGAVGPISLPDAIIDYQIDSTELRNKDRTSSYQLWDDEAEMRVKGGGFIHQRSNGDIDIGSTNKINVESVANTDAYVGADSNKIVVGDDILFVVGDHKSVTQGESVEYGDSNVIKNADGTFEIHSDTEVVIKAPIVRICGELIVQGNAIIENECTISGKAFTPHVHAGVIFGPASTSVPVAGPGPGPPHASCPGKPQRPSSPVITPPVRRGP